MNFNEAFEKSWPLFEDAVQTDPDKLMALVVIPEDPDKPDGPGKFYIVGADDVSELDEIEKLVEVHCYHWRGKLYRKCDA